MDTPIVPIRHLDVNQCPECEGIMVLMEIDTITNSVDKKGMIIIDHTCSNEEVDLYYVCTDCGKIYDVEKEGIAYRIKRTTPKIVSNAKYLQEKERKLGYNPFYNTK